MIADLKPYAEYKDSGLPWLGQVPGHWDVRRMKSAVANVIEQTPEMSPTDVYVALEHVESWTGKVRPQSGTKLFTGLVKRFKRGDVLFGKLRPYLAKVTRLPNDGVCAGEFFVLRPINNSTNAAYLAHLIRSKQTIDLINGSTFGAKMPRADWQFCGNLPISLPPPAEQAAIVRFLDWANGRLERAIRAKRKVIALLNEQKQAIIHRAVTRGLDPSVPLKPSGIPWLGEIPAHWEVKRLKHLAHFQSGDAITSLQIEDSGPYPVYGGNGLRGYTTRHTHDGHHALIGRQGALCGNINFAKGKFFASEHAVVSTVWSGLSVEWFGELLRVMNLNQYSQSAAQPGLAVERIRNLCAPVPPIDEQEALVEAFKERTTPRVWSISRLEREINLLREYRTRLVADVVTGKLDVREAAAQLPEEAPLDMVEEDAEMVDDPEALDEEVGIV